MAEKHGKPEERAKKTHTPKKSVAYKEPAGDKSVPSMTPEETEAYLQFSQVCADVYKQFEKGEIDTRITQLKSSPALVMICRFIIMIHDLVEDYGVMGFNKNVSPTLYKKLEEIQEQTGQKMPLARILLDGIKTTKMETLSGVTRHRLPAFHEPEFKVMTKKKHPHEEDESQGNPGGEDDEQSHETSEASSKAAPPPQSQAQHVGPGGPLMDDSVKPQPGTAAEPPRGGQANTEDELLEPEDQ